jgi:AraC family transcriptional regulator
MMDAKIINRNDFWVVGLHYRGTNENEELPALWRQFWPRHKEIEDRIEPTFTYGVIDNFNPVSNAMDYLAGIEVPEDSKVPEGMVILHIPAQTYAVFQCTLPTLMETIGKIHDNWFPNSEYERAEGPEFELYDERFDADQGKLEMSVWIPVVKKLSEI